MMSSLRHLADAAVPSLASHLWSSTLFLLFILAAVIAFRSRLTASGRFALVLTGIAKFAIPAALVIRPLEALMQRLFPNATPRSLEVPAQFFAGPIDYQTSVVAPRLWPAVLFGIWFLVALALVVRLAVVRSRAVELSVRTALAPEPREVEALYRARLRVGIRRSVDIARSPLPEAPAVLRVFRPLVVLPAGGCDDLSDGELESLLCHECAHVARHDNLIARIEALICALFWFHPLIWIAQRITSVERERACDEVVAGSADERETYLAALTKFCRAAIAPRLPGVSCMATAKLKERMDHVMEYPKLKAQSAPTRRVAAFAVIALAVFTLGAGLVGSKAFAGGASSTSDPYAIRIEATLQGDVIKLAATISRNDNSSVVAAPTLNFPVGQSAKARANLDGVDFLIDAYPDGEWIKVDVAIERDGQTIQKSSARLKATVVPAEAKTFSGQPISMDLKDADLRDLIGTFGKLTGLDMHIDVGIEGKVTVKWINVPWDQAFDSLLKEQRLTYRTEGHDVYISKLTTIDYNGVK